MRRWKVIWPVVGEEEMVVEGEIAVAGRGSGVLG